MENQLKSINVKTKAERDVVDITKQINELLGDQTIKAGFCHIFVKSNNIGLTTSFLDPEEDLAVASVFEITIPDLIPPPDEGKYHRHVTPLSASSVASFLGPHLSLPFENKQLVLGENQRIVLVELKGPREHEIIVSCK